MAKVLLLDIETSPIIGYAWSIWNQNIGLNQIKQDWFIISWAAKWLGSKEVLYQDQRHEKDFSNDKKLMKSLWKLLDEADAIITQNGKAFDIKKINARFVINDLQPPSSFKHIDTREIAKRYFGFTSNKLEYMADKLCQQKKSKHKKFEGFELWKECLNGNLEAWKELEKYNKLDVLVLEELWRKLDPYAKSVNLALYDGTGICNCGSDSLHKNGKTAAGMKLRQRYRCGGCGAEYYRGARGDFIRTNR